jgi:hypothetical protein
MALHSEKLHTLYRPVGTVKTVKSKSYDGVDLRLGWETQVCLGDFGVQRHLLGNVHVEGREGSSHCHIRPTQRIYIKFGIGALHNTLQGEFNFGPYWSSVTYFHIK